MNKPEKYRKKPVVIQALQFRREENLGQVLEFTNGNLLYDKEYDEYYINTLEGDMAVKRGNYIIKGVDGEFYPIQEEIFYKTYEPVEEDSYE